MLAVITIIALVLAGGLMSAALAVGPLLAGLIITSASYETLGVFASACALGALLIMIYVIRSPVLGPGTRSRPSASSSARSPAASVK